MLPEDIHRPEPGGAEEVELALERCYITHVVLVASLLLRRAVLGFVGDPRVLAFAGPAPGCLHQRVAKSRSNPSRWASRP